MLYIFKNFKYKTKISLIKSFLHEQIVEDHSNSVVLCHTAQYGILVRQSNYSKFPILLQNHHFSIVELSIQIEWKILKLSEYNLILIKTILDQKDIIYIHIHGQRVHNTLHLKLQIHLLDQNLYQGILVIVLLLVVCL